MRTEYLLEGKIRVHCLAEVTLSVAESEVDAVRTAIGKLLPASLLKHADEQTLIALRAMQMAREQGAATSPDWGLIAGPSPMGRNRLKEVIAKFQTGGAWSVTPHFIPHCMLHSLSGLLTQAFGLQGPQMGVGPSDLERTAASWLCGGDVPGVWLIRSEWLPEQPITAQVRAITPVAKGC